MKANKNNSITLIFLCAFLLALPLMGILMLFTNKIHYLRTEDFVEADTVVCVIYQAQLYGNSLYIEGGVAQRGVAENYTGENKYLFFINNDTGKMYETRVGEVVIEDKLTNYINDGNDYSLGGFSADLDLGSLDIFSNSYSIYCCIQNFGENLIKDTGIDIEYGELIR